MNRRHCIVFQIGTKVYGLASANIKEVGRTRELRLNRVPKTPAYIKGIINLRGEVVPVIDLQAKLEGREAAADLKSSTDFRSFYDLRSRLIIVRHNSACYGLLADQILGHRTPEADAFLPPTAEMNELTPYIEAIVREPDLTYFLLDLNQLF